jgi:hypothetical protein
MYQSDKLVALSGVVKEIKRCLPGTGYVAGQWLEDMHHGLAWLSPRANATKHER